MVMMETRSALLLNIEMRLFVDVPICSFCNSLEYFVCDKWQHRWRRVGAEVRQMGGEGEYCTLDPRHRLPKKRKWRIMNDY